MTTDFNRTTACAKLAGHMSFNLGLAFSLICQATENESDLQRWRSDLESALASLEREKARLQLAQSTLPSNAELVEFQTNYIIQVTAGLRTGMANALLSLWCACRFGGKPIADLDNAKQWLQQELDESRPELRLALKENAEPAEKADTPKLEYPVTPDTLDAYEKQLIHQRIKSGQKSILPFLTRWKAQVLKACELGVEFSIERYMNSLEAAYRFTINEKIQLLEQKLERAKARRARKEAARQASNIQTILPLGASTEEISIG